MRVKLGKVLWELHNHLVQHAQIAYDPKQHDFLTITDPVVETRVFKYKLGWFGLTRKLLRELSYEAYLRDMDSEMDKREYN